MVYCQTLRPKTKEAILATHPVVSQHCLCWCGVVMRKRQSPRILYRNKPPSRIVSTPATAPLIKRKRTAEARRCVQRATVFQCLIRACTTVRQSYANRCAHVMQVFRESGDGRRRRMRKAYINVFWRTRERRVRLIAEPRTGSAVPPM